MIPIVTEETLETIKEQAKRDWGKYATKLDAEFEEKQPELVLWIKITAEQLFDQIEESVEMDEEDRLQLQAKMVSVVYLLIHSIYAQDEVDQLVEDMV